MLSLLQLETYLLDEVNVYPYPDFDRKRKGIFGDIDINHTIQRHKTEQKRFRVSLSCIIKSSKDKATTPYYVSFKVTGYFVFTKKIDEPKKMQYMHFNALPMLYSIARGIIGNITSQGRYGTFPMPSVNFAEYLKGKAV